MRTGACVRGHSGAAEFCGERGAVPLLCPPPSAVAERRGVARAAEGHVAAEEREARRRKWVARRRRGIWWPRAPALTRGAPIELPCSGTRRIEVTVRVLDSASSRAAWTALLPSPSARLARRRRKPGRSGGAPARAPASRGGARWGGGRSAPSTSLAAAAGTPRARRSLRSVGTTRGSRAPRHISSSSSSSTSARFGAWRPIRNDCVPVAVPCCEGFLHQRVRYPQIQFGSRSLVSISASGPMCLLFFYFFPFFFSENPLPCSRATALPGARREYSGDHVFPFTFLAVLSLPFSFQIFPFLPSTSIMC